MVLTELLAGQVLNILQFVIVLAIGIIATKLVTDMISKYFQKEETKKLIKQMGYDEPMLDLILMVVRYTFYFVTFIIAIAQFGFVTIVFEIIIIIIALFIIVLLIYSLKDFIPNAAAGIYLSRVKSIRVGDTIKVGVYSGKVMNVSLITTSLKDKTGRLTIIPNANLTKKEITIEKTTKRKKK